MRTRREIMKGRIYYVELADLSWPQHYCSAWQQCPALLYRREDMGSRGTEVDSMVMGAWRWFSFGFGYPGYYGYLMGILMGTTGTTAWHHCKRTGMSSAALKLWRIRVTRTG